MAKNDADGAGTRRVQAVDTAMDIVEALCDLDGATVTELSNHLGLSTSAVHTHLRTLERRGFVVEEELTYRPSLQFLGIGELVKREHIDIYRAGRSEVKELADTTGEYGWIMVEERGKGLFVYKEQGENAVETGTFPPGRPTELHTTACGKCILAHLPEERRERIIERSDLEPVTSETVTDPDELREQLQSIRDRGYAITSEESVHGVRSVASPVLSEDGTVLGAISISGPLSRIGGERFRETLPERLTECSNVIEIKVMQEQSSVSY